ncbi:nucleotide-sugar transporter [Nitzschia inconspicua]|uniref:Nucleotide-sugar transporter n=1 Tax=Nitzschia inconspicua TaxID=303405 RepID=A0A9K3KFJ7_9STRA|nr:nucleotide-sugar transporter [Nitzschia inconspicua]
MMPNHSQKLTIDLLMSILTDLQSVTKALQAENRTVLDVRDLFDEVIKTYPQTKNRLGENASIIHDNVFEIAVQKILKGSEEELTPDESMKVTGLRNETSPMEGETKTGEERDADAGLSLAEKALSDDVLCPQRLLMNLHFIVVPTSNMCERLFSEAGYGLNTRRMRTLPSNFETQMFLRTNKTFCGLLDTRERSYHFICVYFGISLHQESMISSTRHSAVKPIANGHIRPKSTLLRNESTNTNDAILGEQAAQQQPSLIPKSFTSSLGPISLMGGTAAIYTSLLQHPSSSLTQFSFVFMMLLAIQYALQPRLSRRYISPKIDKQSVAFMEEIVKTGMAAAIFIAKPATEVQNTLKDWTLSSSLAVAGLPAMLYAIQGVLQYVSYQHLDSVTFNGLTQTKTLSAAFCCWLIMGKQQSPVQMVALGILFGSALVFQGYIRTCGKKPEQSTTTADPKTTKGQDDWLWRGIFPCLAAAFLSGLAGALSQKGLQMTGIQGRDPFLYTVEISFYSAVSLLLNMMLSSKRLSKLEWHKQSTYWNWKTLIPIIVKAAGGVVTALVHKYAGSVSKGFALMFGLVLSNMIQLTTKQESLQPYQVWGTLMIMSSTWLFFTH